MSDWLNAAHALLASHPQWLALAIFAIALLECLAIVGILLPGVVLLFGVATLAMAFWTWPGADNGPLLQRLRYVDTFEVVGYGLLVLAAGGFGAVAGLAFHTVFGLCIDGCAGPARVPAPGEGA